MTIYTVCSSVVTHVGLPAGIDWLVLAKMQLFSGIYRILHIFFMTLFTPKYCLFSLAISLCSAFPLQAQTDVWNKPKDNAKEALKKGDKGKKKVKQWKDHVKDWGLKEEYTHQLSLGAKLNSNGWSGCMYYMKTVDVQKKNVFCLSFSEIKHEKQIKQEGSALYPQLGTPSPFVYGKINNLYTLQLGVGRERVLLPKVIDGNISVGARFTGGFSLAMLKPYYLRLIYEDNTYISSIVTLEEQQFNEAKEPFLKTGNKLGASPWTKGLDEMKYIPGAFAEAAVVIEPTSTAWFVQTITLGGNFAFYTKKLPTMAEVKALPWQGSLFVGLALGKRW